jgi:acyl-CoA thioester hydrolase
VGEPFRHRLRVRFNECDPQNAVFNANYLAYFDIGITELWRELGGYDEMVKQGLDLVVAEARVRYLAPLRFDEEFDVAISVADVGTTSLSTEITIERGGETVAEGELRHVFVTTDGGGKTAVPDGLREALSRYAP